mmetsp:Transcript_10250/g.31657  ORF Transcript_10250/g.31657 Transcript_10250/m.31657 type:complete len:468 (-) Transcript_10250:109-1512(-)
MSTQDFSSLYSSGDLILQNPIESSSIFLMVVVVCASIEYLFSLAERVDSKFFKVMFGTISEEVLVFGVLSLMLTFGSSLVKGLPAQWAVMFDWAHICLLFMTIMFVVLLCIVCVFVFSGNRRWSKFEADRIHEKTESHSSREQRFRMAHEKFQIALRAHGFPTNVNFTAYVLKAEKENLVALGNLSWKSWLALSTIVVLNAQRTRLIPQTPSATDPDVLLTDTNTIFNIGSFVAVAGYGTLGLFLALHVRQQLRFRQYLMLTNQNAANNTTAILRGAMNDDDDDRRELTDALAPSKSDLDDPLSFLLWQSHENSMALVQAVLMFLVWYAAVFCLNMLYKSAVRFDVGVTLLILCFTIAPIVVFVVMVPWTLTTIAILSSLGTSLKEDWVKELLAKERETREGGDAEGEESEMRAVNKSLDASTKATERNTGKVVKRPLRPVLMDDASMHRLAASYRTQGNASGAVEL